MEDVGITVLYCFARIDDDGTGAVLFSSTDREEVLKKEAEYLGKNPEARTAFFESKEGYAKLRR